MRFYVGVTDPDWYRFLASGSHEDINFWQPGGNTAFKALQPGEPFLFKLKGRENAIGGLGFFSSHSFLPLDIAWTIFGQRNGLASLAEFRNKILHYRNSRNSFASNPNIGCIVLTDPVFFQPKDWIPVPPSWAKNIVTGKGYSVADQEGQFIWQQVEERMAHYAILEREAYTKDHLLVEDPATDYARRYLSKVRLGQGAFRVQLTDAYMRRCSITGEKTLPVLEAAHIKPWAESGPNRVSNGILLRADMHKLYDSGYLTVSEHYMVEVSGKLREDFENGKEYYRYHGQPLQVLPSSLLQMPEARYIQWHNENIYKG
jgi:putative restriction endonuclease